MYKVHLSNYVMPRKSSDDFPGLFVSDRSSMHPKTSIGRREESAPFGIDEPKCAGVMSPDESARALALLARWVLRRAGKEGRLGPGEYREVVTVDFSKTSGDEKGDN